LDDLASLDPDLYKGLIFLKHYKGNPEDLSLNFTVAVEGEWIGLDGFFEKTLLIIPFLFLPRILTIHARSCIDSYVPRTAMD